MDTWDSSFSEHAMEANMYEAVVCFKTEVVHKLFENSKML